MQKLVWQNKSDIISDLDSQFSVPNLKPPVTWNEVEIPSFFDHYKRRPERT
jgi:hypothetical protein